ncbi:MAG: class I SAM-dependent methyltransferase [bacterium]|nr:class I SAM-dependent methyltransferase [bacterium]
MDKRTKNTIATYDRVAQAYAATNRTTDFWSREYKAFNSLLPKGRILEIGCGGGRDAIWFLKQPNYTYLGTDLSRGLLRVAKRVNPKGNFRYLDLYDLTFPSRSFDGVWSAATLLHVPKRRLPRVLKNIHRILRPGGIGCITIKERRNVDEVTIKKNKYGGEERFFAFWSKYEFMSLLRQAGFNVLQTYRKTEEENIWLSFIFRRT